MQRAQIEWAKRTQKRLDYINSQIVKERKAEKRFTDLNSAMQQYFLVTGRQLEPLPAKPVLSDEIDHLSDLHVDCSFYKQSTKFDNYFKIKEWIDSSIGQSTVLQELDKRRPTLSNLNQTQNRRRYVNSENGSHFIVALIV